MKDSENSVNFAAIGEKIRSRRVKLGLSQEQLAELCGITPSYVGHIERASRQLSLNTAISISTVLEISLDYLLLDVKNENGDVGVLESISAELKNHSPEQVSKFLNTVKILAENIDEL
ncbi:MAG: helix-turn-helix transcriptional regulator [Ruminococcus sp.]|nr:helix-turn-helix transcriptional regulator [Ruminococcus sp.]